MNQNLKHKRNHYGRSSDFIIRVKSGTGASLEGKVEHVYSGEVQYFKDYLELVLLMQSKLDDIGAPQCDTELRSFSASRNHG